jgi:hypothetical protein
MFRDAQRSPFSRFLPAIGAFLSRPVHGLLTVVRPQPETTQKLLELSQASPMVALCAHDAHGLPSYEAVFESMAMYLPPEEVPLPLPQDATEAAARVTRALGSGRAVCAFRALGEPAGFALEGLASVERRGARVGDVLRVRLPGSPEEGSVRLEVWGEGRLGPDGMSVELTGEGVVRVEVWARAPGRFFARRRRRRVVLLLEVRGRPRLTRVAAKEPLEGFALERFDLHEDVHELLEHVRRHFD